MHTDQLKGLIALKVVAEQLNFRAAARVLGVSASAVSQAIKQLEQRLGVALLTRTTRSTSLTEAGVQFLNQAGPGLDQILQAIENTGAYAKKPSGLLRLNLPRVAYPTLIAPLVDSFLTQHPEVNVQLIFDDDLSDIVKSGFDAGIRISETTAKDVVGVKLSDPIRFIVAGSPKYFKRMGRPKHPRELLAHNCICAMFGDGDTYDRWEFESKGKDFNVQVKGSLVLNDTVLLVRAAIEGTGLIYTATDWIQDELKTGKLEVVLNAFAAQSDGFYLYYPKRSQVLPKLRAFVDHIKNEIKLGTRI
jgi:DNA-binding transcriptional LysR family regulator